MPRVDLGGGKKKRAQFGQARTFMRDIEERLRQWGVNKT
jgi:hypothetical protein